MRKIIILSSIFYLLCFSTLGQEKQWEKTVQQGDEALKNNQLSEAAQAYESAIKYAQKFKEHDPRKCATYIKAAEALQNIAKSDQAETYVQLAIQSLEKALARSKPDDPEEIMFQSETAILVYAKASAIYKANHKYTEAIAIQKQLILLFEQGAKPLSTPKNNDEFIASLSQTILAASPRAAEAYEELASLYFHTKQYTEAIPAYQKATQLRAAKLGAENPIVGLTIAKLATVYLAQGDNVQAETLFRQAYNIFAKHNLLNRRELLQILQYYEQVLIRLEKGDEAAKVHEHIKAIQGH